MTLTFSQAQDLAAHMAQVGVWLGILAQLKTEPTSDAHSATLSACISAKIVEHVEAIAATLEGQASPELRAVLDEAISAPQAN